ncbi:MAG: hypothetical protein P4L50_03405 [Anaerolineaceae bacterium]|nr:hypothetical protein [Anaerolineaceae bacterium]
MTILNISVAVICTVLIIAVEHYLPWQIMLGKHLPRIPAYILGTLATALPFSVLLWLVGEGVIAIAFWGLLLSAGVATVACYALDSYLDHRSRAHEAEEREEHFRKQAENLDRGYVND